VPTDPSLIRRADGAAALAMAVVLLVSALACLALRRPPAPVPASAPPEAFSAERAMRHVTEIAKRPHPIGSEDHARVRAYLEGALVDVGLETHVQSATGVTAKYRVAGAVENVVGRLRGARSAAAGDDLAPHPAVLLAAHYDSVASGPGAGDDASGVAAILEALRALRAGSPLQNDVVVLFSDGEEVGLLGASAFMADDPWARDVRVVVNLEARGNAGVSSLFETSAGNGVLVRDAATAAPRVAGSSLAYEVYKRMPNDTDATVFKAYGLAALNFAFVGHWGAYHTPEDDAEHLDRGSLQQQGDYALGLARRLGDADLAALGGPDAVFFDLPGGPLVRYSSAVGVGAAALAALLLLVVAARARAVARTRVVDVLGGVGVFGVATGAAAGAGFGLATLGASLRAGLLPEGDILESVPCMSAVVCFGLLAWVALHSLAVTRARLAPSGVALGAASVLVVLALVVAIELPGLGYLFVWPAIGATLSVVASLAPAALSPAHRVAHAVVLPLAGVVVVVPLLQGVFEGLGVTPPGGALAGALTVILAASVATSLETITAPARGRATLALGAAGALLFAAGVAGAGFDDAHPKPSRLWYVLDLDAGRARWATSAASNDRWLASYVGDTPRHEALFPGWNRDWLVGDAPRVELPAPAASVVSQSSTMDARTFTVELHAGRDAALGIDVPRDVTWAAVDGHELSWATGGPLSLTYLVSSRGVGFLSLRVRAGGAVPVTITERWRGTPDGQGLPPRPAWEVPHHDGDQTVVRATLTL
jgi:hypothetical protein